MDLDFDGLIRSGTQDNQNIQNGQTSKGNKSNPYVRQNKPTIGAKPIRLLQRDEVFSLSYFFKEDVISNIIYLN